jgi:hypothetical protein
MLSQSKNKIFKRLSRLGNIVSIFKQTTAFTLRAYGIRTDYQTALCIRLSIVSATVVADNGIANITLPDLHLVHLLSRPRGFSFGV